MVVNRQRSIAIALEPLEEFAGQARRALRFQEDGVTVCLISDAAIARLNRRYRGKSGPTDVLSFPANRSGRNKRIAPRGRGPECYSGDIAISPATARRNARRYSRSLAAELRVLILHGMLHLAGYDHERDTGQMDRLERRMRRRLGIR